MPAATLTGSAMPFRHMALIGVGLIGSSIAHAARKHGLVESITAHARTAETRAKALELGLADAVFDTPGETVAGRVRHAR